MSQRQAALTLTLMKVREISDIVKSCITSVETNSLPQPQRNLSPMIFSAILNCILLVESCVD